MDAVQTENIMNINDSFMTTLPNDVRFRSFQPQDTEQLTLLYEKSIKYNAEGFIQDLNFHGDIVDMAIFYQRSGGEMLVAVTQQKKREKVVGFGGLKPMRTQEGQSRVELCKLHVDVEYQGKGIGKRLTQTLIRKAQNLNFQFMELHVTASQRPAINLYKKLGFKTTQRKIYNIPYNNRILSFDTLFMEIPLLVHSHPQMA